jgi:hypothetical protein
MVDLKTVSRRVHLMLQDFASILFAGSPVGYFRRNLDADISIFTRDRAHHAPPGSLVGLRPYKVLGLVLLIDNIKCEKHPFATYRWFRASWCTVSHIVLTSLRSTWAAGKAVRAGLAFGGRISKLIRNRSGSRRTAAGPFSTQPSGPWPVGPTSCQF